MAIRVCVMGYIMLSSGHRSETVPLCYLCPKVANAVNKLEHLTPSIRDSTRLRKLKGPIDAVLLVDNGDSVMS